MDRRDVIKNGIAGLLGVASVNGAKAEVVDEPPFMIVVNIPDKDCFDRLQEGWKDCIKAHSQLRRILVIGFIGCEAEVVYREENKDG